MLSQMSFFRFLFAILVVFLILPEGHAQIYELKDHRQDTIVKKRFLADTATVLADSVWHLLKTGQASRFPDFTPTYEYLATTFDSLQIKNNPGVILVKQRYIPHNLQKQYLKVVKQAGKQKIKLSQLELLRTEFDYGVNDKGHRFAYVTYYCKRRNKDVQIKILLIKLLDYWFMGDELSVLFP